MTGDINQAIDQLADRLGVAADKIMAVIPQYAQMRAMTVWVAIGIMLAFAVACTVTGVALVRHGLSMKRENAWSSYEMPINVGWAAIAGAIILLAISAFYLPEAIGWTCYPDAKVADMVLGIVRSS